MAYFHGICLGRQLPMHKAITSSCRREIRRLNTRNGPAWIGLNAYGACQLYGARVTLETQRETVKNNLRIWQGYFVLNNTSLSLQVLVCIVTTISFKKVGLYVVAMAERHIVSSVDIFRGHGIWSAEINANWDGLWFWIGCRGFHIYFALYVWL